MIVAIILVVLVAAVLFLLHYGYKLAFYYKDPLESPYAYGDSDQIRACKEVLDDAIGEYEAVPCEEVSIRSHDGLKLTARYYHVADGAPLQILCHGYKGNAIRDFCGVWRIAREAGHNVLLIDQRSHGKSEGHTITFGIRERMDCLAWVNYAAERFGDVPMLLGGVSMGAATVLMAAGMKELPGNVKCVIADCPYDAPSGIIKKVLGKDMGMPVGMVYPLIRLGGMVYGGFDLEADSPREAVKRAQVPILLIHGDEDRFVPYDMSCNIHAAAPESVEFHTVPGAGHALNYVKDPQGYTRILREFIGKHL